MSLLPRSYLFAPGDNEQLIHKMPDAGADALVIDLEDSVHPSRQSEARIVVAGFLEEYSLSRVPVYVRINPVGSHTSDPEDPSAPWRVDLEAVVRPSLHGIRLAKAESAEQIATLDQHLTDLERRTGIPQGKTRVVPTIESARGVLAALEIASHPRVEALCFGMADFVADIGAVQDLSFTASLHALSHLVLASRASGIRPPIASVHTDLDDLDGLRASSELYRRLGFFGRSCIHPKQIASVHAVFTPSDADVQRARSILAAYSHGAETHRGTAVSDGEFVDQAVVRHARDIIALAESFASQTEKDSR